MRNSDINMAGDLATKGAELQKALEAGEHDKARILVAELAQRLPRNTYSMRAETGMFKLTGQTASLRAPFNAGEVGQHPIAAPADLGILVRRARKAQGLTQQRFADLASLGRRFVSELEAGKPSLEFGKVMTACKALGIDILAMPR